MKPNLIIIAGFPGSGKTTTSKIISKDLGIPRLETDFIAKKLKKIPETENIDQLKFPKAHHSIAYELIFSLAEDLIENGQRIILDMNMAHEITWKNIENIKSANKIIFILDCPFEVCCERVGLRYEKDPEKHVMTKEGAENRKDLYEFIQKKKKGGVIIVNSIKSIEEVVKEIKRYL